jgi:hypothetical protein
LPVDPLITTSGAPASAGATTGAPAASGTGGTSGGGTTGGTSGGGTIGGTSGGGTIGGTSGGGTIGGTSGGGTKGAAAGTITPDDWTAAAAHGTAPAAAEPAGASMHVYPPPVMSGVATACGLNANAPKQIPALAIALMANRSKLTVTVHSLVTSSYLLRR